MIEKQKTLKEPIYFKGVGLHSGLAINLCIKPAPEDHGYLLKRVDLEGQPTIKPVAENVVKTERGTMLEENGAQVNTVEHFLAALKGMGIDNALIEIDAPEVPIMDGSSKLMVEEIERVGVEIQSKERDFFEIKEKISFSIPEKGIELTAYPDEVERYDVFISFESTMLKNQFAYLDDIKDFKNEVSDARTFVFARELEFLLDNGLIKGGSLDNAVVIAENEITQERLDKFSTLFGREIKLDKRVGVLNSSELRHDNEPAKHKLLDVLGDLTLIGKPIKGRIIARKPGHLANVEFAKILRNKLLNN
jgi:UDP-3-O-[3-hydroxymyristoyl] N-acetylglucosamine deacetylase/3-hydroxyacyl-[acyl-carrier-protein] dehydratase